MAKELIDAQDSVDLENNHVHQLIASWKGYTGQGVALRQTSVSDASNYAGDFKNGGTGGKHLRATHSSGSPVLFDATDARVVCYGGLTGEIRMVGYAVTAGVNEPTGWLYCNGQAVSRTTYAALFSAIGTSWGAGDGSTTFNVPDLRDAIVGGVGPTSFTAVGGSYGTNASAGAAAGTLAGSFNNQHQHAAGTLAGPEHDHGDGSLQVDINHNHPDEDTSEPDDVTEVENDASGAQVNVGSATHRHTFNPSALGSTVVNVTGDTGLDGTGAVTGSTANAGSTTQVVAISGSTAAISPIQATKAASFLIHV
jgi:microcystin-dependent protein